MKARVKATGALLEVRFRDTDTEHPYICDMEGEHGTLWKESELEFLDDDPDYWTRLEHTYVGMFMKSFLDNFDGTASMEQLSDDAIALAHALVEKYKKEEK